jgi:AcrR family transcriptional regulator
MRGYGAEVAYAAGVATSSRRLEAPTPTNGRDRPNSRGDATRLRILLKAEELFAQHGIAAVPLRDIGIAAGQKNNVAVQYHFRDRDTLVREIAGYRAVVGEAVRSEMLAELLASGRALTVRDVVRAYMASLSCHLEPGDHYLAFLARYTAERGSFAGLEGLGGQSTIYTFTAMLRRLLPDVPEAVLGERWDVMMTSALHTMARYQTAQRAGTLPAPLPVLVDDLVSFFAAALAAPSEVAS